MYDKETIESVCTECLKETKIVYKYKDSFFKPKLRGINHLEVGRSSVISSPWTIILEFIIMLGAKFNKALDRVEAWLFPRIEKTVPGVFDSEVVGRITFSKREDVHKPIHSMTAELWARTWWFAWKKLGEGISDKDGNLSVPFNMRAARSSNNHKVILEIYETTHVFYHKGEPQRKLNLFKTLPIPKKELIGLRYNLHDIQLFFWEYSDETPVPRVVIKDHDKDAPQYYVKDREIAFMEQVIPIELTKIKHIEQVKLHPDKITMESMQSDYPVNLTVCIEKKLPGYTRSDEWMGKRMLNGMNRAYFQPDKNDPDQYWIKYFGICRYPYNDEYALPTARVRFTVRPDGLPIPVEIRLTGPLNSINKDPWQERILTPQNGDDWLHAKRVVRVNGAFTTELDEHFTGTHLDTEQYAIAAYRNLRLNPISTLLLPHLKEVVLINHSANKILLKDFIPHVTALTPAGLNQRTRDVLGVQDWKNWRPMKPINETHTSAQAEDLFWETTYSYVSEFIDANINEIKKYWFEVYRFSEDLINHSVPVFLSDLDMDSLSEKEHALAQDRFEYYCGQYGFDSSAERERRKGELKTVSPITHSHLAEDETIDQDIQNLKQACSYMIMIATYMHTWINEHQYDELGEVMYSCGGLRYGTKERGILAPESDLSISPDILKASQGLWLANILSRTEYGFITENPENDVNPMYVQKLLAKKQEFKSLGVDITQIESRTNI